MEQTRGVEGLGAKTDEEREKKKGVRKQERDKTKKWGKRRRKRGKDSWKIREEQREN